jgi:phage gp36-like protein
MTRHNRRRQQPKDPITNLTELVNNDLNLLIKLVHRFVDIENKQERYRTCTLIRMSRIEAMLTQVLGCQLAQYWAEQSRMTDELRTKHLQEVENKIQQEAETLGIKMVRYIHEEAKKPEAHFDRRRKWWGWEI